MQIARKGKTSTEQELTREKKHENIILFSGLALLSGWREEPLDCW